MKFRIVIAAFLIILSNCISAQFVGDGASKPASTPAVSARPKPAFTLKYGLAMPLSTFGTVPANPNGASKFTNGQMGAKTGFFVEAGLGMNFSKPDNWVGFYYFPLMMSYWKTSMDWSNLEKFGKFFSDKAIYTKPVSALDIGQRYGVLVNIKPVKDLSVAVYWRPGLIVPFDFAVNHKVSADGAAFLYSGTMATGTKAPVLVLSSTPGLTVKYSIFVLSLEAYSVKPTYTVTYSDPTTPAPVTVTGKIPIKMFVASLGLCF
jgi:hypothetical protein